jgi:hypothetical protein
MIRSMPTTARPQQRYDHRFRELVHRTKDVSLATDRFGSRLGNLGPICRPTHAVASEDVRQ